MACKLNSTGWRRTALAASLIVILLVLLSFAPLPPHGKFLVDDIATDGLSSLKLDNGIAQLVIEGAPNSYVGRYTIQHGSWYLEGPEETNCLKANLWGLTVQAQGEQRSFRYSRTLRSWHPPEDKK